jgi:hypothetical protein
LAADQLRRCWLDPGCQPTSLLLLLLKVKLVPLLLAQLYWLMPNRDGSHPANQMHPR